MTADGGERSKHWPTIERRYGRPISHWLDVMAERANARYPEQIAFLREEHGFSQAHANAVVMFARGSSTSRRFTTLDGYLADKDASGAATVRAMFAGLVARHPGTEVTLAWNQPFLTRDGQHLFSVGVMKGHLLAAPWSVEVLEALRPELESRGLQLNRKTFRLPLAWVIDEPLLDAIVSAELANARDGAG
jgi:uncharacterized protein YdhG (YjbR/CyaY superfamily)